MNEATMQTQELGPLLEELRGKLSLREAAHRSGLSHAYIRDLELSLNRSTRSKIAPSPETLQKLARAYRYPYHDLLARAGYLNRPETFEPQSPVVVPRILLEWMKDYVEKTEVALDGEFGRSRELAQIIEENGMPEEYQVILNVLDSVSVS